MSTELPDLAIVVRGGVMTDFLLVRRQVEDARDRFGAYVLSVWAKTRDPGQTVDHVVAELVERGGVKNHGVRVTTAGRLRSRGFDLRQTGAERTHYSVDLGGAELETVARFVGSFGPVRGNPRWRR